MFSLLLGITINLTAFLAILFFNGFVANKLNNSSLSTKWTNFSRSWTDSLSIGPIYSLKTPAYNLFSTWAWPFFWEIKETISIFDDWFFLFYFFAIYCFWLLLIYLLVDGNKGISPFSLSTLSLTFNDSFFSFVVPALITTPLASMAHESTLVSEP